MTQMQDLENRLLDKFYPVGLGSGNINAKYMFIGMNPSKNLKYHGQRCLSKRDESKVESSYYFVPLIEKYCGKDGYYNTNVVKVPTQMNLLPSADQVKLFIPYLKEEIQIVGPQTIIALGNWVYDILIKYDIKSTKIYHPAYILRTGQYALHEEQIKNIV